MSVWRLVSGAIAAGALAIPSDAPAADRPHIEPIERTPYSRDDNAPPTPLGFIIGSSALVVVLGGVGFGLRRRTRQDDRARWLTAHPDAHHDDEIDPWLARDAVKHAKVLVHEVDEAWTDRDADRVGELAVPALAERWRAALERGGRALRVDEYSPLRVTFVTQLETPRPDEDRLVVHVRGAVRDPRTPVAWSPARRALRRFRPLGARRGFAEFWTLRRGDGDWTLLATERDRTARPSRTPRATAPWAQG